MYTLEDIERIIKPENLIACRGQVKNPFDMHILGANFYIDPKSQDIYRLTKDEKTFNRILEKINDTEKKYIAKLKKNPNEDLFRKKANNNKEIWFFNVSKEEYTQNFRKRHEKIELECKKDNFVGRSNKKIKYLQKQTDKKKTAQNNLSIEQLERIIRYENIIAIEATDSDFMKNEGNSDKNGSLYYQDPENPNIVVQESIRSKPKRLIVVTKEKNYNRLKKRKK